MEYLETSKSVHQESHPFSLLEQVNFLCGTNLAAGSLQPKIGETHINSECKTMDLGVIPEFLKSGFEL